MKLYLIRHAEAIDYETETVTTDEYRFITPNGRQVTRKAAKFLKDELADLDKIFTSPLIRAVQTAEIFAVRLKFKGDVEPVNELKNEATISSLQNLIKKNSNLNSIALVGHDPKMSILAKAFSDKEELNFEFKKSGVCLIGFDLKNESGKFIWFLNPKTLEFVK